MDMIISLIKEAAAIAYKVIAAAIAQEIFKRVKGKIAPTHTRDDSDSGIKY